MVLSAIETHKTEVSRTRSTTLLSFFTLEKLMEVARASPGSNECLGQVSMLSHGRNWGVARRTDYWGLEINVFESVGTRLHQCHHPLNIFLQIPQELEFPKVDAVRKAQQQGDEAFHPWRPSKFQGSGQGRRSRRFEDDIIIEGHSEV